jgi:taurine dioxygenase
MGVVQTRVGTASFGVEVVGFDPELELDDADRAMLRAAFDEHGLLRFREIDLGHDRQRALVTLLHGAADAHKTADLNVSNREDKADAPYGRLLFHSDSMWSEAPTLISSLYATELEPPVVPTQYASAMCAWDTLPDDLRSRVGALHALHVTGQQPRGDHQDELLEPHRDFEWSTTTPIALPHPRTGRTVLYVSEMMTREIVGLPADESDALLEELFAHLYAPANTTEHEWRVGDLVVWDNIVIQHARANVQIDGPARTLRKVSVPIPAMGGDVPKMPQYDTAPRG